uniref:Uncharacterized protein n=1 Tax=Oryza punctata TaxID=4537 RepID=A0A0E0LV51_ORYPU
METRGLVRVNASSKVSTEHGGSARVVPHSQSSTTASLIVTYGKTYVCVSAQEPTKTKRKKKASGALLLLPPWETDKF